MKRKDELEDIARMTHGDERRALLLAEFAGELRATTTADIAKLGTETLFSLLGVDTRRGAQRGPAVDPELDVEELERTMSAVGFKIVRFE